MATSPLLSNTSLYTDVVLFFFYGFWRENGGSVITEVEVPRALWVLVLSILIAMQICSVARWPSGKASVSYLRGFETFADNNNIGEGSKLITLLPW